MPIFNSTSKIKFIFSVDQQSIGVVLPKCSRELFSRDIDKKIRKIQGHISHLYNALPHRNTHGGGKYRTKQISIQNQIQAYTSQLNLLKSAKEMIQNLMRQPRSLQLVNFKSQPPHEKRKIRVEQKDADYLLQRINQTGLELIGRLRKIPNSLSSRVTNVALRALAQLGIAYKLAGWGAPTN